MHDFIILKQETNKFPPLDRKTRSEIRGRNKILIKLWMSQIKDPKFNKLQRGMIWRKVSLMTALENAYSRPFTEAEVMDKMNVSFRKWSRLTPWNLGLIGHPVMAGLVELYYNAPWFGNVVNFFKWRRTIMLGVRACSFFRMLLGSDFLHTNYTFEEFKNAITPRAQKLIVNHMLRRKASRVFIKVFPYMVIHHWDFCKEQPVMAVMYRAYKQVLSIKKVFEIKVWSKEILNDFPFDLFEGLSSEFFGGRNGGRAPVFTNIYRLNAFILTYFGANKDCISKTYQLDTNHWIRVRYETYTNLSIETGINAGPDLPRPHFDHSLFYKVFDWNRFNRLLRQR